MKRHPLVVFAALLLSCSSPEPAPAPLPPGSFAFGVFGDGPYRSWENGRFHRVLKEVNRDDLQWLLHVGDIFWYPCSDANYERQLAAMNSIQHPVVYTPGDNEWVDCHEMVSGRHEPLERLHHLRSVFFAHPGRSLGARAMRVTSQAENPDFAEFVENVRWVRGGFVFATMHLVGADNAQESFARRTAANDEEVVRRTAAALAWMDDAFAMAAADSLRGVVLAMHGYPGMDWNNTITRGYEGFVARLEENVRRFPGPVLLIHGDAHALLLDHPLRVNGTAARYPNVTRLETFGSPHIGWVRVVVDSVAGTFSFEPRKMKTWWLW